MKTLIFKDLKVGMRVKNVRKTSLYFERIGKIISLNNYTCQATIHWVSKLNQYDYINYSYYYNFNDFIILDEDSGIICKKLK